MEYLKEYKTEYFFESEKLNNFRADVENQQAKLLASGEIEGKNETERKAKLAERFEAENKQMSEISGQVNQTRLAVELAQIDLDVIRYTLRIYELMKG